MLYKNIKLRLKIIKQVNILKVNDLFNFFIKVNVFNYYTMINARIY